MCANGTTTFLAPHIGVLQLIIFLQKGFKTDFQDTPPTPFNYTGSPLTAQGTLFVELVFNLTVELVGTGIQNFDPENDPAKHILIILL